MIPEKLIRDYFIPTTVLDIGANVGEFYRECKECFPDAYYYLIEPNPECKDVLDSLGVDYLLGAVSDIEKEATFYISKAMPRCTGNSLYREVTSYFSDENVRLHTLTTTTLDKLFPKYAQFDLIKIDTQGSELDILRGGMSLVKKAKGLIVEVAVANYNIGAPLETEVKTFLDELGFIPVSELQSWNNPETYEKVHVDLLFINKKLLYLG